METLQKCIINKAEDLIAEVIAVFPNRIKIEVKKLEDFSIPNEQLKVGSYISVSDTHKCSIIGIIDNFIIEKTDENDRKYILEATPIGFINCEGEFSRSGHNIAIPPKGACPASTDEIKQIYAQVKEESKFCFSRLSQNPEIKVCIDGDKFFNKHIAIVGSTGSGKSCTVAKLLQSAIEAGKEGQYKGLNNSHIIVFDIHSEYRTAFPNAHYINMDDFILPYWLMNGEELEELFVETGEHQAYNQISLLQRIVTTNKQKFNPELENISFDTPVKFSIQEVLNCIINLSKETRNSKNPDEIKIKDNPKTFDSDEKKYNYYFKEEFPFEEKKTGSVSGGTYNDSGNPLEKFISRIRNKFKDKRLKFLFDQEKTSNITFLDSLKNILGYGKADNANITIVDLSGVPFEVLSTTVSLLSRLVFEYGYYYKRMVSDSEDKTPFLLVYEEAHKYVPKSGYAKYNSSRIAIERIAKEGRKYGVTLAIVSQRPSEISETIFSQCNNFIAMRLTNPQDQDYVKRLLPDDLGPITDSLPTLGPGEAILIGDSIIMPSLVMIERCAPEPSSNDIKYLQEWKKKWVEVEFEEIAKSWTE